MSLDDMQRHLLALLDGTRSQEVLLDALAGVISQGELVVYEGQRRITDPAAARRVAGHHLAGTLASLANLALLVPT